jgi:hypothetical protein
MALSDQLTKLAARAKQAEDRAAAAKVEAKADVEQDLKEVRESSRARADAASAAIEKDKEKVSSWWADVQRSWNKHIAAARDDRSEMRAAHDRKVAEHRAEQAEADASFAIDFAYGAVEEAEHAVLASVLARMDADELAEA